MAVVELVSSRPKGHHLLALLGKRPGGGVWGEVLGLLDNTVISAGWELLGS